MLAERAEPPSLWCAESCRTQEGLARDQRGLPAPEWDTLWLQVIPLDPVSLEQDMLEPQSAHLRRVRELGKREWPESGWGLQAEEVSYSAHPEPSNITLAFLGWLKAVEVEGACLSACVSARREPSPFQRASASGPSKVPFQGCCSSASLCLAQEQPFNKWLGSSCFSPWIP